MAAGKFRLVYCKHEDCRIGTPVRGRGDLPAVCPGCERRGEWTSDVPAKPSTKPAIPFDLTVNDRRFLKSLRIAGDA